MEVLSDVCFAFCFFFSDDEVCSFKRSIVGQIFDLCPLSVKEVSGNPLPVIDQITSWQFTEEPGLQGGFIREVIFI